jgi:hypothetical protein
LLALFSCHLWAVAHGFTLTRSRTEFDQNAMAVWGYATPSPRHLMGMLLGADHSGALWSVELGKLGYLGVVTLALLAYAAIRRVGFRRVGYLWSTLVLMLVLSLGASWKVGAWNVSLPSAWLWNLFPLYRLTRAPSRFSLLVGVVAGVLAAAGLKDLLTRLPGRRWRAVAFGGLTVVAVADLAIVGSPRYPVPELPGCYRFLKQRDPHAALLEIPYTPVSLLATLSGECTYWQSLHRLNTSAGYSGHANTLQAYQIGSACPFLATRMAQPDYLDDPTKVDIGAVTDVDFKDYVWIYLAVNPFDYVVLHRGLAAIPEYTASLNRLEALLRDCAIYEDAATIVYARSRLKPPARPVVITRGVWKGRNLGQGEWNWQLPETSQVAIYNPDPEQEMTLSLSAAAVRLRQSVRIRAGTREVARWEVMPGSYQTVSSPPFQLPAGLQELTIESRTQDLDLHDRTSLPKEPKKPDHLRIAGLKIAPSPNQGAIARRDVDEPLADRKRTH